MPEFRIGKIEYHPGICGVDDRIWKFIIAEEGDSLVLYAGMLPDGSSKRQHADVAESMGIERCCVMGGGFILQSDDVMGIRDFSTFFGPVPNSAMEEFVPLLFNAMAEEYGILRAIVDMYYNMHIAVDHMDCVKKWKSLGYEFDSGPRWITR